MPWKVCTWDEWEVLEEDMVDDDVVAPVAVGEAGEGHLLQSRWWPGSVDC